MREPKSYQQMVDDWNAGVGTSTYETDRTKRELSGLPTEPPTTVYPPPNIVPVGRILTAAEHAAIWRKMEQETYKTATRCEKSEGLHRKADVLMLQAEFARGVSDAYNACNEPEKPYCCSFCGKPPAEVRRVVAGLHGNICDECTAVAVELLLRRQKPEIAAKDEMG